MTGIRIFLAAVVAVPLLAACAGTSPRALEEREPKVIRSNASVSDLVICLKSRLTDEAKIIAYPEPGKVDVRIGERSQSDSAYFHVVSLRQARSGTTVEIRSADEFHPFMSAGRVAGMVEDCKPGTAR